MNTDFGSNSVSGIYTDFVRRPIVPAHRDALDLAAAKS